LSSSVQDSESGGDAGNSCADPIQEFKKVFLGASPLFNHSRISLNISESDITKEIIPKPLRGSKSLLIWRFIELLRSKKFAGNCIFWRKKPMPINLPEIVFFGKISLRLFNPILHTAWLDNHALTLKSNSAKYYFHEKSRSLHTFLKFCCESRKI
jgi:hypothetical protein